MTTDQKKPEPGILDDFKEVAREGYKQARDDFNSGIDGAMRAAHYVGKQAKDTYQVVEDTVGRERLWGAGFGAKVGGGFMVTKPHPFIPGYIAGIGVGTIVGAAVGFAAGPWLAKRYRAANDVDDKGDAKPPAPTPPAP